MRIARRVYHIIHLPALRDFPVYVTGYIPERFFVPIFGKPFLRARSVPAQRDDADGFYILMCPVVPHQHIDHTFSDHACGTGQKNCLTGERRQRQYGLCRLHCRISLICVLIISLIYLRHSDCHTFPLFRLLSNYVSHLFPAYTIFNFSLFF